MQILNPTLNLELFFKQLSKSRLALLILDYDGTLAPFKQNPNKSFPYPGVIERIQDIMAQGSTEVIVISGRGLDGLISLLNMRPLPELWGSHGGERLLTNSSTPMMLLGDSAIKAALAEGVVAAAEEAPDLLCERKPLAIALHWRGKDNEVAKLQSQKVLKKWNVITQQYPLEVHLFDCGFELRPKGINKGEAVRTLLQDLPLETPIAYLGDDLTDEDAFEILGSRALKVLVRKELRPTKADIHLIPPIDLLKFFDWWIQNKNKEKF